MDSEKSQEPARAEKPAAERKPVMVQVVYRGPSALLVADEYELRQHEPAEIPQDLLDRMRLNLPDHVIDAI